MTPEERAEARRLTAVPHHMETMGLFALGFRTIVPKLLGALEAAEAELGNLRFLYDGRKLDLETAERERDEARTNLGEQMAAHGAVYINIAVELRAERDTARAQVATLAEALREILADSIDIDGRNGERALGALKAVGGGNVSYTSLYGVPASGGLETVAEYRNGWGSAPVIWKFIWDKYLRTRETEKNFESAMNPIGNLQKICNLAKDDKLQKYERICVQLTCDMCIIRKEDFAKVAEALDTMYLATYRGEYVNHLRSIATDLRDGDKWADYIGCCFRHTSVGDAWTVYENDECSRPYDVSRDEGHWFLEASET